MAKKKVTGEDGKTYVMKEKKPIYKRIWFWVLAVLIVAGIAGSLGGGNDEKGVAKKVDNSSEASDTPKESNSEKEEVDFKIGDTIDIDGYQIKVNDVKYSDEEGFTTPDEGKEFIIINLTITNKTGEKASFNPLDFAINEDGVSSTAGFEYVDGIDTLSSGDLDPDATVTGNLAAQVKKESSVKLRYEGNFFLKDKEVDVILR